jgi:fatty acid omega-hydroxylase
MMELFTAWNVVLVLLAAAAAHVLADWLRYRGRTMVAYEPFVGNTRALSADFHRFSQYCAERSAALGHPATLLIKLSCVMSPRHLLLTPADLEHVQKTNFGNYLAGKGPRSKIFVDMVGRGLINTDGAHWLRQRKIIAREFSPDRFRYHMTEVFAAASQRLIGGIADRLSGGDAEFDATTWFPRLTLDAFCKAAMRADVDSLSGKPSPFSDAFDLAAKQMVVRARSLRIVWPLLKWLNVGSEARHTKAIKVVDDLAYSIIDDVIARPAAGAGEVDDLMSRLIPAATDEKTGVVDRKLLRDICVTLLVAGRDTTSVALQWLFYELTQHPDVEKELMEEIESAVGAHAPNYDNCNDLQYLTAIVSETLRLHPSAPITSRYVAEDDVLPSGLKVKAGEGILFSPYVSGRRPDLWGEDADVFRPSRWMDDNGTCVKESHFKHTVFIGGRRVCVGQDMAVFELKMVAVALLQRFRFTLKPGSNVRVGMSALLQMEDHLILLVAPR